jgi:hypothetical protein
MPNRVISPGQLEAELLTRRAQLADPRPAAATRSRARVQRFGLLQLPAMLAVGLLLLVGVASTAFATHVQPVFVPGNPSCADLGFDFEVKIEPVVSGTTPAGNPPGFVTVTVTGPGVFNWASNLEILAVIAKGGNGANVYYYNPPTTFADTGLVFPQGSSHISFCFDNPNVPQGEPLDVTKDATGTSELVYTWDIDKVVVGDSTKVGTPPGTVTFDYKVTVTHDAGTEGSFAVTGTITVTNSNAYDVTGVTITDWLNDAATTVCTVTGGTNATIPANDSADFAYSCSPADDSATQNSVKVEWPNQAGPPALPAGDATFVAAITWGQDTIDECVSVDDDLFGPLDAEVCVTDPDPIEFLYTLEFDIPASGCAEFTNTASFETNDTGTTGDDSATVTVCADFDGCTPGFWKNHLAAWGPTGYAPSDTVGSVFTGSSPYNTNTLLQALKFDGGSGLLGAKRILLRVAVAAVLNASHPDVDYAFTEAEVIADVNAALASGSRATILALAAELDEANNAGCSL